MVRKTNLTEDVQRWDVCPYDVRKAITGENPIVDYSHCRTMHWLHSEKKTELLQSTEHLHHHIIGDWKIEIPMEISVALN